MIIDSQRLTVQLLKGSEEFFVHAGNNEDVKLQFQRGTEESAGYDILSKGHYVLKPQEQVFIKTGIFTAIEPGWVGICKEKSGLALNKKIRVKGGVIDSDYRGEWGIIIMNGGETSFTINRGDKITQVVFVRHGVVTFSVVDKLCATGRGFGAYGSTGK